MNVDLFSANETYLFEQYKSKVITKIEVNEEEASEFVINIKQHLEELDADITDDRVLLDTLSKLYSISQSVRNYSFLEAEGFAIMQALFPLINHENADIQAHAYLVLTYLADHLDRDEVAENIMNQLICISWDFDEMDECFEIARLSSVYFALFGKGLLRMTKARDWMLFLPFLSNYIVKTIEILHYILKEKSIFFYSHNNERSFSKWDQAIVLAINNYLDFVYFIHAKTVSQEVTAFPFNSHDIGSENGDVKRRYLGYYLLNLIYDRIISNFDLQLSRTYYEHHMSLFHSAYAPGKRDEGTPFNHFSTSSLTPMFDTVYRCMKLSKEFGHLFEDISLLESSLQETNEKFKSAEDEAYENDRQMINSRLYPLSSDGIATLFSISLYDRLICPSYFDRESVGLLPNDFDAYAYAKKYIGSFLNLITRPTDYISRADKGIFAMLYLSRGIKIQLSFDDIEKTIPSYNGSQPDFPVSGIIMYLSSTASTCPDDAIRFLSFKLIEKFLDFGDDETRAFFLLELIETCPFPSMNTAAIGLLKNYISKANTEKTASIFISPMIVERFFPIIFKFKSSWIDREENFWNDYSYIMEVLNLYFFLLKMKVPADLLAVRKETNSIRNSYLEPLENLIGNLEPIKVYTINHLISLIKDNL